MGNTKDITFYMGSYLSALPCGNPCGERARQKPGGKNKF